jgi:hypothetical protein
MAEIELKKLLITGCGRSGTFYATEVWRSLGLDIRHERPVASHGSMGKDGMASWFMTVDDPNPPFGPSATGYEFEFVLHLVRHPLKVIASAAQSILGKGPLSYRYIERNVPEVQLYPEECSLEPREQLILLSARYWYHWNLRAQEKASRTIQVERLIPELPRLCESLDVDYKPGLTDKIPRNTNARWLYVREEPWVIEWADIKTLAPSLFEKIRDLSALYGY